MGTEQLNRNTDEKLITTYKYEPTYFYLYPRYERTRINGTDVSLVTHNYKQKEYSGNRYFPFERSAVKIDYLKNDLTHRSFWYYDNDGNLISSYQAIENRVVGSAYTYITLDNQPYELPYKFLLTKTTVTQTNAPQSIPDPEEYTRISDNTYNNNGLIMQSITDSGTEKEVTTDYFYDDYGNPKGITLSSTDPDVETRKIVIKYDDKGLFPIKKINPLNFNTRYTYDYSNGNILTKTSINDQITQYSYDNWGGIEKTILPNGNILTSQTSWKYPDAPYDEGEYLCLT